MNGAANLTTDGTCSADKSIICGDWSQGSCCSSSGYCGSSEAHCGAGCQSGPCEAGSGPVIIDPKIWESASPTISCFPPCTFVLPPQTLSTAETITVPPATETFEETFPTTSNGITGYTTITKVTTITIPMITASEISVYEFNWTVSNSATQITVVSSIIPPPLTLTESSTSGRQGFTYTYSPGPVQITTTSKASSTPLPPISIHATTGYPGPKCSGSHCPSPCKSSCGPPGGKPPCIGICGCLGLGCNPKNFCLGICPPGGGGDGGGGGSGEPTKDPTSKPTSCATSETVSECEVVCSSTAEAAQPSCTTSCFGVVACAATGTTTTVNSFSNQPAPVVSGIENDWLTLDDGSDVAAYSRAASHAQIIFAGFTGVTSTTPTDTPTGLPVITSCALSTQAATVSDGTSLSETVVCSCNDDITEPVITADGSVLVCDMGKSTATVGTTTPNTIPNTPTTPDPTTTTPSTTDPNAPATTVTGATPTARFMMELDVASDGFSDHNYWYAYSPPYNEPYSFCLDSIDTLDADQDIDPTKSIPFPDGTFKIQGKVSGEPNCMYIGTADAAGTLSCDKVNVQCFQSEETGSFICDESGPDTPGTDTIYPKLECAW